VPVLMQGGGWKATSWLGLVTAGSLWTPLFEEENFETNVRMLHEQLLKIIGGSSCNGSSDTSEESGDMVGGSTSPSEAKEELERLRESQTATQSAVLMVLADPTQPATMPAGVPQLPARFQPTEQIRELTRLVLSTTSTDMAKPRVGFFGMGGIGKTVTGAAIVRDDAVRQHFHGIVWLPLGQTPMIAKLQNLCHMQCTGKELSSELSSEEKKEALKQAMSGKCILLCLDDLWEEVHETELNFADVSAGSKVLISTRVKGLLAGAHQVEVCLPSASDSSRMLLTAADVADDEHGSPPKGVEEIVDLCGRLPLALGIAGRLAASLGLVGTQDWCGMIGVLKEELRESHSGGTEEGIIRASLRGLKGSVQEKTNVKALLKLFALVPEDTHCPLEVTLLMFKAVNRGATASIMHIRKWLRILIDRSLVLGTIDRPSVHDLVLDFAVAQFGAEELREQHRCVVEAFRGARPADVHGRCWFDSRRMTETPMAEYVCQDVGHHISNAWAPNMEHDTLATTDWLGDVPQDAIVISAGHVLGTEKLSALALAAETAADWWLAARYWSVKRQIEGDLLGMGGVAKPAAKTLSAIGKIVSVQSAELTERINELHFAQVVAVAQAYDVEDYLKANPTEVQRALASTAASRDPIASFSVRLSCALNRYVTSKHLTDAGASVALYGKEIASCAIDMVAASRSSTDSSARHQCLLIAMNSCAWLGPGLQPDFDWDAVFGKDGTTLDEAADAYDYQTSHPFLMSTMSVDFFQCFAITTWPIALHYVSSVLLFCFN